MSNDIAGAEFSSNPLVDFSPHGIVVVDNAHVIYANEAASHVFYTPVSELILMTLSDLNQSQETLQSLLNYAKAAIAEQTIQTYQIALMSGAGLRYYSTTFHPDGHRIYIYFQDISALIQTERSLQTNTTHDSLTGLFNRPQLFMMATQDIARSKRYRTPLSLLVINIANIRSINQSYGYAMGDHVLINVSRALQDALRESDYAARLDNKSFVICLIDATLEQTEIVANRINAVISERNILIADTAITIELAYGHAQFDNVTDHQFDNLLLRAEKNCDEL
ncbi:sensor domain-containing diguanylate cyclase [Neptunomonas antarctica]|uniref:diguanylate cyclase n=1 Tax=Neptunomonas antarctica TaxID=619304 RepID=A0A1N7NPK3_9GAMM|nr:sensor domain-containing diguanylate cyclase [Neptunomonas antarctica]SIT00232.1 diguanylate cyclase (GGDEF) domain-containing protein [Neptunomonas antarctica]